MLKLSPFSIASTPDDQNRAGYYIAKLDVTIPEDKTTGDPLGNIPMRDNNGGCTSTLEREVPVALPQGGWLINEIRNRVIHEDETETTVSRTGSGGIQWDGNISAGQACLTYSPTPDTLEFFSAKSAAIEWGHSTPGDHVAPLVYEITGWFEASVPTVRVEIFASRDNLNWASIHSMDHSVNGEVLLREHIAPDSYDNYLFFRVTALDGGSQAVDLSSVNSHGSFMLMDPTRPPKEYGATRDVLS